MGDVSIGQAIRNAIEAERAAARFYKRLGENTKDAAARAFLESMAKVEIAHAESIEKMSAKLIGSLPERAEGLAEAIETAPAWKWVEDLDLGEALQIALEAENNAALFYSAVADALDDEAKQFFEELSDAEAEHAKLVNEQLLATRAT